MSCNIWPVNKTELIFAPGTSPEMKKIAEQLPPYDLLKAYREATHTFNTTDIVLVVAGGVDIDGFHAFPRGAYIEKAFRRWTEQQKAIHPLVKDPAHKRLQTPADSPAFWLVVEIPAQDVITCCAIGAYLHRDLSATS
jgi:hypothetical protein